MIEVQNLTKVFRKPIRGKGIIGMIGTLFSHKYEETRAVDDVSLPRIGLRNTLVRFCTSIIYFIS